MQYPEKIKIESIDEVLTRLQQEAKSKEEKERFIQLMEEYSGEDEVISSLEFKKLIDEDSKKYSFKAYSSIKGLDEIIGGFNPGNVVVISGPTKEGKTTFAQTLTNNFILDKMNCLWFSFDTPAQELVERFSTFQELPIFYLPKSSMAKKTLDWIERKIVEGFVKFNTRLVFIDHLDFLVDKDTRFSEASELARVMREVKAIAMKWNIIVFMLHHINKIESTTIPLLSDLKGSSGVAQESDFTIMIWRSRKKTNDGIIYGNTAIVSVQANRRTGKTGVVKVVHSSNQFIEENGTRLEISNF